MRISIQELLIVFVVALFVLGPDKLPLYARKAGEFLREFRKVSSAATKEIRESIVEPLEEAQRPLREAMEPLTDLQEDIQENLKDIKKTISDVGKPLPADQTGGEEVPEPEEPAEEPAVEAPQEPVEAGAPAQEG